MPKSVMELVKEYLSETKLMQIATAKENKPWAASVWFAHDDKLNLYFISRKTRRHSIEIKENGNVAGVIVKPHLIGSGEKVRGLQFEGTAKECSGEEIDKARELYLNKYPTAEKIPIEKLKDPEFHVAYYVIKPKMFVLFDEVNFPEQPRQELKLEG
jgi:uncharacterized protein YhbP (UPF0306 family)